MGVAMFNLNFSSLCTAKTPQDWRPLGNKRTKRSLQCRFKRRLHWLLSMCVCGALRFM
uniref:Uncharacterized protein n=1 Tax=Anguilla anguilla TaxID=7936 RepID=A0A0E9QN89_ANGAN